MSTINGTSGSNSLVGTSKSDDISGRSGNDTISGLSGNDDISGGSGNDVLSGGSGKDELEGGSGNDVLFGGSGNDELEGGSGDDLLFGGSGNDELEGGSGDDLLFGGSGNDELEGGRGDDILFGGSGKDELEGGSGDDILIGDAGADWLEGGCGNDIFRFLCESDSSVSAWDRILDFKQGQDKIDLSALLGKENLAWGGKLAMEHGAWFLNSGSSTFVLVDLNGNGKADFKIELKDSRGLKLTTDDFLGVGNNTAPEANDDNATTDEDTSVTTGTVLANDSDADNILTAASITGFTQGTNGTVVSNSDGTFTYTPNANFNGADSFTYTISDGALTDTATVNVTINPVNDAPVAVADGGAAGENETKSFDVLANDTDVDANDTKTLSSSLGTVTVKSANGGVDGIDASGAFSIDGNQLLFTAGTLFDALEHNDNATVVVNYTMHDGQGAPSSSTLTLTVNGANDAPVAGADIGSAGENETKTFDVLTNDNDVDFGDTKKLSSLDSVIVTSANGHVDEIDASAAFSIVGHEIKFTPGALFDALDFDDTATVVVNYTMEDSQGAQSSSMLTLTVNGANDAPVAVDDTADASAGSATGNVLFNLATGDTDPDFGDSLIVSTVLSVNTGEGREVDGDPIDGQFGSVTFSPTDNPQGKWTYSFFHPMLDKPKPNPSDYEVFQYTIDDGHGGTDTAELVITFENIEDFFSASTVNEPVIDTSGTNDTSGGGDGASGSGGDNPPAPADDPNAGGSTGGNDGGNGSQNGTGNDGNRPMVLDDTASANAAGASGNVLANDKGTNLIVTKVNGIDVTGDSVNGQLGYITFEDTQDGDWNYYLFNPANAPSAGSTDVFEYTIADAISGDTDVGLLTIDFTDYVL